MFRTRVLSVFSYADAIKLADSCNSIFYPKKFTSPRIWKHSVILNLVPFIFCYMYNEQTNAYVIDSFVILFFIISLLNESTPALHVVCMNTFM